MLSLCTKPTQIPSRPESEKLEIFRLTVLASLKCNDEAPSMRGAILKKSYVGTRAEGVDEDF